MKCYSGFVIVVFLISMLFYIGGCSEKGQPDIPNPLFTRFYSKVNGAAFGTHRVRVEKNGQLTSLTFDAENGIVIGTISPTGQVTIDFDFDRSLQIGSPFTDDLPANSSGIYHITGNGQMSPAGVGSGVFKRVDSTGNAISGQWTSEQRYEVPNFYWGYFSIALPLYTFEMGSSSMFNVCIDADGEITCQQYIGADGNYISQPYQVRGKVDGAGKIDFTLYNIIINAGEAPQTVRCIGQLHADGTGSGECNGNNSGAVSNWNMIIITNYVAYY